MTRTEYVGKVNTYAGRTLHRSKPSASWQVAYERADTWRMSKYPNGNIALQMVKVKIK